MSEQSSFSDDNMVALKIDPTFENYNEQAKEFVFNLYATIAYRPTQKAVITKDIRIIENAQIKALLFEAMASHAVKYVGEIEPAEKLKRMKAMPNTTRDDMIYILQESIKAYKKNKKKLAASLDRGVKEMEKYIKEMEEGKHDPAE